MTKCLLIVAGMDKWVSTRELSPGETAAIGRKSGSEIQLKDLQVSSKHARVFWEKDRWWIEDLGSSNSTYVNGEKVAGPRALADQDEIQIKPFKIAVRVGEEVEDELTLSGGSVSEMIESRGAPADEGPSGVGGPNDKTGHDLEIASEALSRRLEARKRSERGDVARTTENLELHKAVDALNAARRLARRQAYQMRMLQAPLFTRGDQDAFQAMLNTAQRALKADVAFLMLINPRSRAWEVKCKSPGLEDFASAAAEAGARAPISLTLVTKAVEGKRAMLLGDLPPEAVEKAASVRANRIHAALAAPLFERDAVVGCMYVDRRRGADAPAYERDDAEDALACAETFVLAAGHFVARRVWDREAKAEAERAGQAKKG
jgi:pSer/pThr/pTyr-binding forkhead associated (FHA) protein